jgi:hypothetical protein
MRLISVLSSLLALAVTLVVAGFNSTIDAKPLDGRTIFRFDTFGDEQLWTDVLRMHEVIPTISPVTALEVGLKVDSEALPPALVAQIASGDVKLDDPAVTVALIGLNAVVGVKGTVEGGQLTRVGITCALCHSTVDDSFVDGIGRRLDGWPNGDLNVGVIVGLSPAIDQATREEFAKWGPGMYDPRHHVFDGANIIVRHTPSLPVVIPPAYGLRGVGFETYTADGPISYWNAYVAISQMGGHGNFSDPRIGLEIVQSPPDLVAPKLRALLDYQLKLQAPKPPRGSFNPVAAARGRRLFRGEAQCASCHTGPRYTDVLNGPRGVPLLHAPGEVGTEAEYATRSATAATHETPGYRTTPLRGLWHRSLFFHDGSAPDLPGVVDHYDGHLQLGLSPAQKSDLVEFLKSL